MNQFFESIPSGWTETTLGEVVDFNYGKSLPAKTRNDGNIFVYGSNGIIGQHSNSLTKDPSLIIGRKGSIGEVHISDEPCWPIDTTYFVEKLYGQPHKFWLYLLQSLGLSELNRATALPGLNRNDAYKITIKIPPLNEQKRIVVRIEELQTRSRRAREALDAISDLLDQLRQSILAAAFRGDLTKEWRERHPNVEPASELLKRIRIERRKRWENAELKILKAKGLSEDNLQDAFANRRKQYKEPFTIDTTDLPELPLGWCWASCGELLYSIAYGTAKKSTYESVGIGVIRIPNILPNGSISVEDLKKTVFTNSEAVEYELNEGDILIIRSNGSIGLGGRSAVVSNLEAGLTYAGYLLRLIPSTFVNSHWLQLALSTPEMRIRIETTDRSTSGVNNINSVEVSALPIPLAPQVEQTHIAMAVRKQLDYLHLLDSRQQSLFTLLNNLDQAILSKAFRGELVPQDPNDEPASILLERIRQEKARAVAEPKIKDKRKGKKMQHKQKEQQDVLAVLRESGQALTPEEVFLAAGFDEASVDIFYEQLRAVVSSKQVREIKEGNNIRLEAIVP
jgi:type I restriction enzyme, S subunit